MAPPLPLLGPVAVGTAQGTGLNAYWRTTTSFQGAPGRRAHRPQVNYDVGLIGAVDARDRQVPPPPLDCRPEPTQSVNDGHMPRPADRRDYQLALTGLGGRDAAIERATDRHDDRSDGRRA